jgi:ABC-type histidine transport system ATPase subunit
MRTRVEMRFQHQPLVGHAFIVRRKDTKPINVLRKKRVQGRNSKERATTVVKKGIKLQVVGRKKKIKIKDPKDIRYQLKRLVQLMIILLEVG